MNLSQRGARAHGRRAGSASDARCTLSTASVGESANFSAAEENRLSTSSSPTAGAAGTAIAVRRLIPGGAAKGSGAGSGTLAASGAASTAREAAITCFVARGFGGSTSGAGTAARRSAAAVGGAGAGGVATVGGAAAGAFTGVMSTARFAPAAATAEEAGAPDAVVAAAADDAAVPPAALTAPETLAHGAGGAAPCGRRTRAPPSTAPPATAPAEPLCAPAATAVGRAAAGAGAACLRPRTRCDAAWTAGVGAGTTAFRSCAGRECHCGITPRGAGNTNLAALFCSDNFLPRIARTPICTAVPRSSCACSERQSSRCCS